MGSQALEASKLWIQTPVIPSVALSQAAGCNIYLKLENLQPSGSFKSRGIGNMMYQALKKAQSPKVHFYCSSGGNAGLACATAAIVLGQTCTIVVPTIISALMISRLQERGAEVQQVGENWAAADKYLRETLLAADPTGVYVPPFDHPDVWAGASTMIDELAVQMQAFGDDGRVDGIVCSCGGGGLLNGIMAGVERQKWPGGGKPLVAAVETIGAESLNASVQAGKLVTLPGITSIATSLGAPTVSARTFEWSKESHLISFTITDAEAVMGTVKFANDAMLLVETACGATAAPLYNGKLRELMGKDLTDEEWSRKNIVLIVCGGVNISLDLLEQYKKTYGVA